MIPLRDSIPHTHPPLVTVGLILVNCAVFVQEVLLNPPQREAMFQAYALIPARSLEMLSDSPASAPQAILPFFTSMFLHGGWLHLIGNMWFLWIFGDNVEDRTGHGRFLALYVCGGLAGAVTHMAFSLNSMLPTVGASGAIAAVMGAYLITFPGARVLTLVPIFFFLTTVEIPAYLILVYWLLLQLLSGVASVGATDATGGVAWFAHVGGFVAGVPLMLLLRRGGRSRAYS